MALSYRTTLLRGAQLLDEAEPRAARRRAGTAISKSSAIVRMIAIPSPPSDSSSPSSDGRRSGSKPAPSSIDLDASVSRSARTRTSTKPPLGAVGMANRVRDRLGERELEVGDHLGRQRGELGEAGQREPRERDVLRLRGDAQADDAACLRAPRPRVSTSAASLIRSLPFSEDSKV